MINLKQIHGVKLPPAYTRFARGRTTVLYDSMNGLIVYTLEAVKLDWWVQLGILKEYRQEGVYSVEGYNRAGKYIKRDLPLFLALGVPVFHHSLTDVWRVQAEVMRKRSKRMPVWWRRISHSYSHITKDPALFLLDQPVDVSQYRPDYDAKDFVYVGKKTVCIDPIHDLRLDELMHLLPRNL